MFNLTKGEFRDGLCLRYGWTPQRLPSSCVCGVTASVSHLLSCPVGGFPSIRHKEIRDVTASLLKIICIHFLDHGVTAMDGGFSSDPPQQSAQRFGLNNEFRVATFNVRGLTAPWKRHSLERDLNRYRVDVCAVQETKFLKQIVRCYRWGTGS